VAEDDERPCPAFVAFDIDQPVACCKRQQCEARRNEHVRARPERLVHREIAVPDVADGKENSADAEKAVGLFK